MDRVLNTAIKKLEALIFNLEFNMNEDVKVDKKYFDKLQSIIEQSNNIFANHRNSYHTNVNELSYNKKESIMNTWEENIPTIDNDDKNDTESSSDISTYEYSLNIDSSDDENNI